MQHSFFGAELLKLQPLALCGIRGVLPVIGWLLLLLLGRWERDCVSGGSGPSTSRKVSWALALFNIHFWLALLVTLSWCWVSLLAGCPCALCLRFILVLLLARVSSLSLLLFSGCLHYIIAHAQMHSGNSAMAKTAAVSDLHFLLIPIALRLTTISVFFLKRRLHIIYNNLFWCHRLANFGWFYLSTLVGWHLSLFYLKDAVRLHRNCWRAIVFRL